MTERISFGEYMSRVMDDVAQEAEAEELEARFYRRMHLNNLIKRAESQRLEPPLKRHRFSKEIAEELLAVHGAFAHLYVLEEIESNQSKLDTKPMWRDVLTWLDELTGEGNDCN